MDEARPDSRIALGDVAVVREHARDATWLSPHGERLRQLGLGARPDVDVDLSRLDDELAAVVVVAEVAAVERETHLRRLAPSERHALEAAQPSHRLRDAGHRV